MQAQAKHHAIAHEQDRTQPLVTLRAVTHHHREHDLHITWHVVLRLDKRILKHVWKLAWKDMVA